LVFKQLAQAVNCLDARFRDKSGREEENLQYAQSS